MNLPAEKADAAGERVVVVTGSDHGYFSYLATALASLASSRQRYGYDLVVLDFGLSDEDRRTLENEHGVRIVTPEWIVDLPARLQTRRNLAVGIRCALPRVVPGYDIYLWFDCDGWVQDDKFYERYVDIARRGALAIVKEREPAYRFDPVLLRWTLGNFVLGLGLWRGLRCFLSPPINAGFFAVRGEHPFWARWQARYEAYVKRTGKVNMDQHAMQVAINLDAVATEYLDGVCNWICSRGRPLYDRATGRLCRPAAPHEPLAIIHLAGPNKGAVYELPCAGGGTVRLALTGPPSRQIPAAKP